MTSIRSSTVSSGAFFGLASTATMTVSNTVGGALDDVEMAVRDRVERAWVDRDAHGPPAPSGGRVEPR